MSQKRKNQSRLFIYVPNLIYDEVKKHAKAQDCNLTKYVTRAIVMRLNMEKETKDRIQW